MSPFMFYVMGEIARSQYVSVAQSKALRNLYSRIHVTSSDFIGEYHTSVSLRLGW